METKFSWMIQTSWTEISDDDAKERADDSGACNYRGGNTYKHYLWLPQMNSIFSLSTSEFRVYVYDLLTFIASLLALGSSWIRIAWATGKALLVFTSYRVIKE